MPDAGNRAETHARVDRPLIVEPSGSAVSHRPSGQTSQKFADPLLHRCPVSQTQIASGLLSAPPPDGLMGVEVRAIVRQVYQPQPKDGRPEVLPHPPARGFQDKLTQSLH